MGCKVITLPMRKNVSDQGVVWQAKAAGRRVGESVARKPADESNKKASALTSTKVREILAKELGVAKSRIINKALIMDDLGADYTDKCRILWRLQLEFDVDMPVEDANALHTVQDLTAYFYFKTEDKNKWTESITECNDNVVKLAGQDDYLYQCSVELLKSSTTPSSAVYSTAAFEKTQNVTIIHGDDNNISLNVAKKVKALNQKLKPKHKTIYHKAVVFILDID